MFRIIFLLFIPSLILGQLTTSAIKTNVEPNIDGDVINDPVWNNAEEINTFYQKTPDEGDYISEKTVVKVLYSEKYFFVSVVAYDNSPDEIIISDTRRDASLNNSDSFSFIIDTFKDFQTGYLFGTNPAGIEFDAQITGGGEGGSTSRRLVLEVEEDLTSIGMLFGKSKRKKVIMVGVLNLQFHLKLLDIKKIKTNHGELILKG